MLASRHFIGTKKNKHNFGKWLNKLSVRFEMGKSVFSFVFFLLRVKPVGNYWRLPTSAMGDAHYDASRCQTKTFHAVLCSHFNEEIPIKPDLCLSSLSSYTPAGWKQIIWELLKMVLQGFRCEMSPIQLPCKISNNIDLWWHKLRCWWSSLDQVINLCHVAFVNPPFLWRLKNDPESFYLYKRSQQKHILDPVRHQSIPLIFNDNNNVMTAFRSIFFQLRSNNIGIGIMLKFPG